MTFLPSQEVLLNNAALKSSSQVQCLLAYTIVLNITQDLNIVGTSIFNLIKTNYCTSREGPKNVLLKSFKNLNKYFKIQSISPPKKAMREWKKKRMETNDHSQEMITASCFYTCQFHVVCMFITLTCFTILLLAYMVKAYYLRPLL